MFACHICHLLSKPKKIGYSYSFCFAFSCMFDLPIGCSVDRFWVLCHQMLNSIFIMFIDPDAKVKLNISIFLSTKTKGKKTLVYVTNYNAITLFPTFLQIAISLFVVESIKLVSFFYTYFRFCSLGFKCLVHLIFRIFNILSCG